MDKTELYYLLLKANEETITLIEELLIKFESQIESLE